MGHSTPGNGPRIDGETHIPALLIRLSNRLSSGISDTYLRLFGIGINEFRILTTIIKWPGCYASFVAERVGVHKGIISRSLKVLERMGLIYGDEQVRGRKLFLTQAGIDLHDRVASVSLRREQLLLAGLSKQEVVVLRSFLKKLTDNLAEVNEFEREVG